MRKRGWEVTASQRRSLKAGGDGGLMAAPISSHQVQPALDGQIPALSGKGILVAPGFWGDVRSSGAAALNFSPQRCWDGWNGVVLVVLLGFLGFGGGHVGALLGQGSGWRLSSTTPFPRSPLQSGLCAHHWRRQSSGAQCGVPSLWVSPSFSHSHPPESQPQCKGKMETQAPTGRLKPRMPPAAGAAWSENIPSSPLSPLGTAHP